MNNSLPLQETICALATASGESAIGVIRLAGPKAFEIMDKVFVGKELSKQSSHTLHFGVIKRGEETLDEVLVSVFKAPNSYTGDDAIEISCHGSPFILSNVLQLIIEQGARPAKPGEFTMRAYLNGKMDLSQAEAVADLIAADSAAAHQMAISQMRGGYSKAINELRQKLIDFASLIELELDFSEEDVEFANRDELSELVDQLKKDVNELVDSFATGNVLKSGIPVAIVGEPNAGKSTLLNALLREDKAIVSDIAGTTRDVIEDEVNIGGIKFRFIDTAGIRNTTDKVESLGIAKTYEKLDQASVVLQIIDAVKNDEQAVKALVDEVTQRIAGAGKQHFVVANKVDELIAAGDVTSDHVSENFEGIDNVIYISAKEGTNVSLIGERLLELANVGQLQKQDLIVTNARHYEALKQALTSLEKVSDGLTTQVTGDFLAMDIRQALFHLGEITGEVTTDDLLGNIFANFCIGK